MPQQSCLLQVMGFFIIIMFLFRLWFGPFWEWISVLDGIVGRHKFCSFLSSMTAKSLFSWANPSGWRKCIFRFLKTWNLQRLHQSLFLLCCKCEYIYIYVSAAYDCMNKGFMHVSKFHKNKLFFEGLGGSLSKPQYHLQLFFHRFPPRTEKKLGVSGLVILHLAQERERECVCGRKELNHSQRTKWLGF